MQKKIGRPRENKVDGEQRCTPVLRKVGRPRKVVDGEKGISPIRRFGYIYIHIENVRAIIKFLVVKYFI